MAGGTIFCYFDKSVFVVGGVDFHENDELKKDLRPEAEYESFTKNQAFRSMPVMATVPTLPGMRCSGQLTAYRAVIHENLVPVIFKEESCQFYLFYLSFCISQVRVYKFLFNL